MIDDRLTEQLRALGKSLDVPERDMLAERILMRVEDDTATGRVRGHARTRRIAVLAVAVLVALALTPPVRAAVTDWFGVLVRSGPVMEEEPVPTAGPGLTVGEATELAGFEPIVPETLGEPDAASVSRDELVISMSWSDAAGTVRLDQFEGAVETRFLKLTPGAEFQMLSDGTSAVWFAEPHQVLPLENGREVTSLARVAAPTLIWPVGDITLRLEGLGKDAALEIAEDVLGAR